MSFVCPGKDAEAWGAANRVTLYPSRVQTWILAHAHQGELVLSDADARRQARAVFAKWFGEAGAISAVGGSSGAATDIKVGAPSPSRIALGTTLESRSRLPEPPLLRPGRVVYVPLSFAWRSQRTTMPWPTWRVEWGIGGPCPQNAAWMLVAVGTAKRDAAPADLPPAPAESDPFSFDPGASLQGVSNALTLAAGIGAIVAAAYVWNSFRAGSGSR